MPARPIARGLLWVVGALIVLLPSLLSGQDVENTSNNLENRDLRISGGLHLSNNFYLSKGVDPSRVALQRRTLAKLYSHCVGINAPFPLLFSDGSQGFNLPRYNIFAGINPTYKVHTASKPVEHHNNQQYVT